MQANTRKAKKNVSSIQVPEKLYWIQCSDGASVIMSQNNVKALVDAMPILRYLLLEHFGMTPKQLIKGNDGMEILESLTELDVKKKSFILLIDFLFERNLDDVHEIVNTFGSWKSLEQIAHSSTYIH